MTTHWRLRVLALLLCFPSVACAQSIYKCKQADGAYSYQSDPCPESSTQQELQADERGNIKAAPTQPRSKARSATASSRPKAVKPSVCQIRQHIFMTTGPIQQLGLALGPNIDFNEDV